VFFPLQYPEESRLTVFSPEFFDQEWIIEYLSRSVPDSVGVFIKQHPNHVGQQSPLWIRRLSQLPNVQFLSPELNVHEIIADAEAVVVTNNTVGFEALFYSTPLIVLGQAFYQDTPAVRTVDILGDLRSVVANAMQDGVLEKDCVASIHSLREAVFNVERYGSIERHASGTASGILGFTDYLST
jgi:capsule polysaccharide modification protein KpsS